MIRRKVAKMNGVFKSLEDEAFFLAYITSHFEKAPAAAIQDFPCSHTIDKARVIFAHGEYAQNIKQYAVLLDSENPDHYKRAGAMLHALYKSDIVTGIEFNASSWGTMEQVESGEVLGLSYGDSQQMIRFPMFYEAFHNEMLAFDLSYRLCWAYEPNPRGYDFGYLYNVCHYLKKNRDLTVDSLSMLFRSLMH
jgi:hypothetical protein